jgi:glycosyltransferase involved in cell wall biosynthesis
MNPGAKWIVCQLGARERYAIPRALRKKGLLCELITDFWFPPGLPLPRLLSEKMSPRWSEDLSVESVHAHNGFFLAFELAARLRGISDWNLMIARNLAFRRLAAKRLQVLAGKGIKGAGEPVVFSYSYSALDQFREAKKLGWRRVLGQIDLGPREDDLEKSLLAQHSGWRCSTPSSPPSSYWENWREECALADTIIVNSDWARDGMIRQGVSPEKLVVIPLAYEAGAKESACDMKDKGDSSPNRFAASQPFDQQRPLRVLFLGQVVARKGIYDLIEAARLLTGEPLVIDVVGPHHQLPEGLPANIRFHGSVALGETASWYRAADLFVLPTQSDGFAITQLEAMSHGLPVITTGHCGAVVEEGWNGLIFPPGDASALAGVLRRLVADPSLVGQMASHARETVGRFSIERLSERLDSL